MVKALEGSERLDCAAHCLNTVLKTSLTLSYVELRKKVLLDNPDTEEILEKFSEVASVVKKARETGAKKVGGGVNLKRLQDQIKLPQKASFMYDGMLSSVLLHQKQVVHVLHFLNRADLAAFITDDAVHSKALDIHACLKVLDKTGTVPGAALDPLARHFEIHASDSTFLAAMKVRVADEQKLLPMLTQVKKCKEVVKFLKTAAYSSQLSQMVKQECDTRWNSLCSMLDSLLKVFEEVKTLLTANGEGNRLDGIVLDDMKWLLQFLLPFREETDTLQGQKYPTLPFVVLASCQLRDHCEPQLLDTDPQAVLRARVSAALARKLQPSMAHKIATFLWPQYRHLRMLTDAEREEVYSEVRRLIHVEPDDDLDEAAPASPKKPRLDEKYNKLCTPEAGAGTSGGTLDEVERYLLSAPSVPAENLLLHWKTQFDLKDLCGLAKLAHRSLGKPATSAPSERVFSAAGYLIQERRTRLAPDLVDKTLFLHSYLLNTCVERVPSVANG
ncbi:Transposable element Hobo transposase [Frankliniella fusca]|uniref:Transposable element Hobo transposase n=1 Tax=Frankliniella fusca TaxID=407009 RepID=A0AAE1HR26_9NEOP|nr:Transposable element Hobo transposase [Frankliniella fusca]